METTLIKMLYTTRHSRQAKTEDKLLQRKFWSSFPCIVMLIAFSYLPVTCAQNINISFQPTPPPLGDEGLLEIDFSCMIGNNADGCMPGSGISRFSMSNVTEAMCQNADAFLGTKTVAVSRGDASNKKAESVSKEKFVCGSFFEWIIQQDTDPVQSDFNELHFCMYDTPERLHAVKRKSATECFKQSTTRNKQLMHEKICICKEGQNCNREFRAGFKEPKEANTLCQSTSVVVEQSDSGDIESNSPSILPYSRLLTFIVVTCITFNFNHFL